MNWKETSNLTLEDKEKNRQYILDHLDKYIIDVKGDFFNVDPETLGKEYNYINKNALTPEAVKKIKKKMTETIIKKKEDWELVLSNTDEPYPKFFKDKKTGLIVHYRPLGYDNYYFLIGEFGYREHVWKNYEKLKKNKEEREKKNTNHSSQSEPPQNSTVNPPSPPETNPQNQNLPSTPPPNQSTNQELKDNPGKLQSGTKEQKEEECLKKEREKKEEEERKQKDKKAKEQARQQELKQKREKVIAEINSALNQEPQLTNNELSPKYRNWEGQVNQLTDIQSITNLQERLLADISARRHDKKTAQKVKENLNKVRTGTKKEKEQAWKDLEEQETEKGYQENKEEVENLKKEKAAKSPQEYSTEAKQKIEEKLKNNGVKEDELNDKDRQEWQKLKNNEIKDPDQLVEIETEITQKIYQKGVERKVADLTSRVNQILKSNSKIKF